MQFYSIKREKFSKNDTKCIEFRKLGGNMYKSKKQLKQEIQNLKDKINSEKQEKFKILRNREINVEMYNFIKAILLKLGTKELEIEKDLIKEAERYNLYVEDSYLKYAKKIQLIDYKNTIKIDEFN